MPIFADCEWLRLALADRPQGFARLNDSPRLLTAIVAIRIVMATALSVIELPCALAQSPARQPDGRLFTIRVAPLLQERCLGCHGVGRKLSGLDLHTRQTALQGGVKGPAISPGNAAQSLLIKMVTGERRPQMPPGVKLPPAEIALLRHWIDSGAPWPAPLDSAATQVWWSFKPPIKPAVPVARQMDTGGQSAIDGQQPGATLSRHYADRTTALRLTGTEKPGASKSERRPKGVPSVKNPTPDTERRITPNPIDAFLLARLRERALDFSPPAPRRVLIRRAYLDLIGLPPSPEEIDAFVHDRSPRAWDTVVDRLLASPRYGERWGRHWLDVVRYADSGGFEGDRDRPYAWRYRDYVIDSFNRDLPFDQFLREQIAGDEIAPGDNRALVATGYLAVGPKEIVMENERNRADQLDDLVSTTGQAMLGLTLNCARCHDHKYDPITTRDYYRLSACFAPCQRRDVELLTPDERKAAQALDSQMKPIRERVAALRAKAKLAPTLKGVANPDDAQTAKALGAPDAQALARDLSELKPLEAKRAAFPHAEVVEDAGAAWPDAHILVRGDAGHPGDVVRPGFICSLPGGGVDLGASAALPGSTGRRKALAEWIASPKNPLTARVFVNRVWQHHFGRGLVTTPSNFGVSGELPSNPELLDWLACTFMEGGWRVKPLHKLILMSAAWQQDDRVRPDAERVDPEDRLLWRMPARRLEAEPIRDSILAIAGSLNLQMGGEPVYPPVDASLRADTFQGPNWRDGVDGPSTWRRSIYVKVKRSLLLPELEVFDCPEITTTVASRNVTTTPTQALTLLNDPLILRQAGLFAQRVAQEAGPDRAKQVARAYALAFGREPSPRELSLSLDYLRSRAAAGRPEPLTDLCHALFNANEFVYAP